MTESLSEVLRICKANWGLTAILSPKTLRASRFLSTRTGLGFEFFVFDLKSEIVFVYMTHP
jgi:hypothetical protein